MAGSNETSLFVAGSLRRTWRNAGTPTNGTAGTYYGVAEAGDLLVDTTNKALYQNTGTQASPVWSRVIATGPLTDKTASCYLTTAESGIVRVYADAVYVYLPTYVDNQGLYYLIKAMSSYSSGVAVYADTVTGGTIDGAASKTSGAQYDVLEVICGDTEWSIKSAKGTWS